MKINVEFETVEEMQKFAEVVGVGCKCSDKNVIAAPTVEKEVEKDNSKSDKKNGPKKSEKAKSEDKSKEEKIKEEPKEEAPTVEAEKVGVDETSTEPPKDAEPKEDAPKVTKEELRAACTKAVKSGKAAAVKEVFEKYGAEKLPEVKEEDYSNVLKDVEALQ